MSDIEQEYEEIFISPQNEEQSFLMQLLSTMTNYINNPPQNGSTLQTLLDNIFQEFVNIHPEPISMDNTISIRWSVIAKDEDGSELPFDYEISFQPAEIQSALARANTKKTKIRETTGHLASYRKIKAEDPILLDGENCPICYENYQVGQYKRVLDKCNHTFHKKCVDKWFVNNPSLECPMCRTKYSKL